MVQLVLANNKQVLMHSPFYQFSSQISDDPNTIALVQQPTKEAYKPFSLNIREGFVYFDLWSYSFSLQVKRLIAAHDTVKGVLRIRRTMEEAFSIEEDLLALVEWFGAARHVTVRSNEISGVRYVIVLCELGNQLMLHLEYMTGEARIEFEWSSHQHLVEFDSAQMTGDRDNNLNLYQNIEAITAHAVSWDTSYEQKYEAIRALLQRGEQL